MTKRLILAGILLLVASAGCSSSDTSFELRNGVCYRTRTQKIAGHQTDKSTVQALRQNCGDQ